MKKLLFIIFITSITFSLVAVDTVKTDNTKKSCCNKMDKSQCGKMMKDGKMKKDGKMMKMDHMKSMKMDHMKSMKMDHMKNMKMSNMKNMKMNKKMLTSYMSVQKALASDNPADAKVAFKGLMMNSMGEIKSLSQKGFNAKDISEMRTHFKGISTKMATMKQAEGFGTAYCPMTKAWWIQKKGDKISNPYYGKKMPECGSFKDFSSEEKATGSSSHNH